MATLAIRPKSVTEIGEFAKGLAATPPIPFEDPEGFATCVKPILDELRAWCRTILNIDADWYFEIALSAVCHFRLQSATDTKLDFLSAFARELAKQGSPIPERPLTVNCGTWNVLTQSYQEFDRQARQTFKDALSIYRRQRELEAERAGLKKTPEKRKWDPFLWLAGYQILRWSAGQIADAIGAKDKKRRSVEQQVKELADEIGLTMRAKQSYNSTISEAEINDVIRHAKKVIALRAAAARPAPTELQKFLPPVFRGRSA